MHSVAEATWLETLGRLMKYKRFGRNGHHVVTVNLPGGTEDNQESRRVAGILTQVQTGTSHIQVQRITSIPNSQIFKTD
jgi:esterase/lipase superfamily enzyme